MLTLLSLSELVRLLPTMLKSLSNDWHVLLLFSCRVVITVVVFWRLSVSYYSVTTTWRLDSSLRRRSLLFSATVRVLTKDFVCIHFGKFQHCQSCADLCGTMMMPYRPITCAMANFANCSSCSFFLRKFAVLHPLSVFSPLSDWR